MFTEHYAQPAVQLGDSEKRTKKEQPLHSKHYKRGIKLKGTQERCRWDLKSLGL